MVLELIAILVYSRILVERVKVSVFVVPILTRKIEHN